MAEVERGIAAEVTEAGVRAVSLDRPGIVTPPLKNLYTGTLAEKDRVLEFMRSLSKGVSIDADGVITKSVS